MGESNPAIHQAHLLARLRQLRTDRGESLRAVGEALDWSEAKVSRIETGQVRLAVSDLRVLAEHYGVVEPERSELVGLARASREHAWWDDLRPFYKPDYIRLIGLESASVRVRQFQLMRIPGFLQTPEYTAVVVANSTDDRKKVEREKSTRERRQSRLDDEDARFEFLLDEPILHRHLSDAGAWRRQLDRLLAVAQRPNVEIRILPLAKSMLYGLDTAFELMELTVGVPEAVVIERLGNEVVLVGDDPEIQNYATKFDNRWAIALDEDESLAKIQEARQSYGN
jgi:transcriptional regulator with XRE-family HTH domain